MKKTAIIVAIASAFSVNAIANGLSGGIELDAKFGDNGQKLYETSNGSGMKAFVGYEGFGLSAKRKANFENEYNLSYQHDFDHVWVKGEYEFADKKSVHGNYNDQNKFGVTVGGNVADLFDTSLRLRKDTELNSGNGTHRSDIYRFDLAAGKQVTDRTHLNAKLVGQKENTREKISGDQGKDTIYNVELRATFTAIDNFIPYVEIGNEGQFGDDKRNTYGKVGVVLPF
ncbi:oligogalacturonate-specific porin KdgM family protein [Vibrio hangzhouensis]|uniref:Oligogalacturonate-specific porin protein (KdgM) n=1 Tax=Vibrio hangzhouensis TaxID=462991 RepID=A0A1H5VJ66_9VIBR|nr:oligogalacturonate-specific porin KdgM family protein [Vibrio hangzhouensis]SEF86871.1 Oligogalacturonate-specific porin protein (KdgM) [Vibrio hangzhouensis]